MIPNFRPRYKLDALHSRNVAVSGTSRNASRVCALEVLDTLEYFQHFQHIQERIQGFRPALLFCAASAKAGQAMNEAPITFPGAFDGTADTAPLDVLGVGELLTTDYPPLQWIVPDILPEGLTLLFSRPKIGKSMVALALSLRLALGVGGASREVLYLSLDDTSERRLQSRVRSLLQGQEIENRVWFAMQSRTLDSGLIPQIRYWMYTHPDTRLIVVDVFGAVKPKRKGDDVYKNDYDALRALRDFAEQCHVAILLVHHTRKQVDTEDWINNVNGSTGLTGATDTIWMLDRKRGSQDMQLRVTGRDVEDATIALTLDDLDAPWTVTGTAETVAEDASIANTSEAAVLAALRSSAESLTPKEIAERAGLNSTRYLLRRMHGKGLVTQTTYGRYTLPASQDTPSSENTDGESTEGASIIPLPLPIQADTLDAMPDAPSEPESGADAREPSPIEPGHIEPGQSIEPSQLVCPEPGCTSTELRDYGDGLRCYIHDRLAVLAVPRISARTARTRQKPRRGRADNE